MTPKWKPLACVSSDDNHMPTFLISSTFTPTSYTIHLTDLTYIWSESLSRNSIIKRSQEEFAIIQLEEGDEENLHVFLQKIEGALEGENGTSLHLSIKSVRLGPPALSLNVTAEVKGLGTLDWAINLMPVSQSLLTTQMVMPLLQTVHERKFEVAALVDALKEKDHVIQKLIDKLESQGTDLGQVFPGAVGKGGKKVTRLWASDRVKGLGPFDTDAWGEAWAAKDENKANVLISEALGEDGSLQMMEERPVQIRHQENWWDERENSPIRLAYGTSCTTNDKSNLKSVKREPAVDQDDFQVQATPPEKVSNIIGGTSEDDEDVDIPSQAVPDSFPSHNLVVAKPKPKNIGGLRGRTARPKAPIHEDSEQESEAEKPPPKKKTTPMGKPSGASGDSSTESEIEPLQSLMEGAQIQVASRELSKPTSNLSTDSEKEVADLLPPNLKRKADKAKSKSHSETDSEKEHSPIQKVKRKKGKLGSLSGKRQADDSETESEDATTLARPQTKTENLRSLTKTSDKISSETEDESDSPAPPSKIARSRTASTSPPRPAKPKKGKLGGLKRKATILPPSDLEHEPEVSLPSKSVATAGIKRLGGLRGKSPTQDAMQETPRKLGGLRNKAQSPEIDNDANRGRPAEKEDEVTPPPRETSIERADKKRAELKKTLEAKAKVPAKKKRKF